jgi:hypothetical protein
MIKNLTAGAGININHSYSSWPSFYNTPASTGNSLIGQVRYNGSSQNMEVYDGNTWTTIASVYPQIELNGETQAILNWARTKMAEEQRVKELAVRYPSVADALTALSQAEEQVRVVAALVET